MPISENRTQTLIKYVFFCIYMPNLYTKIVWSSYNNTPFNTDSMLAQMERKKEENLSMLTL